MTDASEFFCDMFSRYAASEATPKQTDDVRGLLKLATTPA